MKFANKLFLVTTVVLTVIFTVFGVWMLTSYFNKTMDREMEQANSESRMFQYLFEITYQSVVEYGEEYAIQSAVDSVVDSVEQNRNQCFVWSEEEHYYGDALRTENQWQALRQMAEELEGEVGYVYGIRQLENRYYLLSVCRSHTRESTMYLGISREVTTIYEDRQGLLNQYRLALIFLWMIGGACIYVLSRYMTKPIRELDKVVGAIADGEYEQRSTYISMDEIGTLADNFNHMADRLVEQMHEKEREAEQKERFTAAFAHELKTPLTSIIGYADMLNSVSLSEEERSEAYYYIYSQGKRLESLSHKLLELVSIDRTFFSMRPVNTKELEENVRVTMLPVLEKKEIQARFTMEEGVIYGDRDLLLSVLYNLLDNAVKAVERKGTIILEGMCIKNGYMIRVVDNGRGIPEGEVDRITEAFYMIDKSRSREEGGAGIGMALCQKIITLHDASMEVESNVGEGTAIRLFFPTKDKMSEIGIGT